MDNASFLTALKSVAVAINNAASAYLSVNGAQTRSALKAATVVKAAGGRVAQVSVTTAGTSTGGVYDANMTGITGNPVFIIPEATGVYVVNMPTNNGILVVPGTGQSVAVSYS